MASGDPSEWNVRMLRSYLAANQVDASTCVEKSELVALVKQALERGGGSGSSGSGGGASASRPPSAGSQQQRQQQQQHGQEQGVKPSPMEERPGTSFYK